MSLILEALRRSEAQRRLGAPPDLYGTPSGPITLRPRQGRWIGALLIAGLGLVLLVLAVRHASRPLPPVTAPTPTIAPLVSPPARPSDHTALPAASATALARELEAPLSPPAPPVPAPPHPPLPVPSPADPAAAGAEALSLDRLDASSRALLPPLRVSMHVYDPDPARRFALVDGRRLREGEFLAPDLRLVGIGRDGLHLDWRGRRLLLPR